MNGRSGWSSNGGGGGDNDRGSCRGGIDGIGINTGVVVLSGRGRSWGSSGIGGGVILAGVGVMVVTQGQWQGYG